MVEELWKLAVMLVLVVVVHPLAMVAVSNHLEEEEEVVA